ncbi:uncharacterized protein LOC125027317 [Penaeus chinensis]|uniref:uncharacterized protein LOC125027317 n=1 Tax=Penaeus chinensis TaxID=139456 RepID=UPI001FB5B640|nr:uncharacterized protein LOC125027317 [Penaeus chinensis]
MSCLTMNDMKPMRTSAKVCGKNGTDFLEVKDNNIADTEASRKGGEEEENDNKRTKCFMKEAMSEGGRALLIVVILLLVLLLTFPLLFPLLSFLTSQSKVIGESTDRTWPNEEYEKPAKSRGSPFHSQKEGKIWLRTERLLPTITLLYDRTTRPVTLYQPDTYEESAAGQRWYFKAVQGHDGIADVEMLLHSSVQKFQLALKNPRGSTTVHHISLQASAKTPSPSHLLLPATPVAELTQGLEAPSDSLVVNLSYYLNDWVGKGSEFSILFETQEANPPTDAGDSRDNTSSYQHFRHSLLQPVVTVLDHNTTFAVREDDGLEGALRETLAGRMAEVVTRRTDTVATLPPLGRHRREASEECQMSMVSVSLSDLGVESVVYPTTVDMKFCTGSCHVTDDPEMFSTNALIRIKYKFLRSSSPVPLPQCTPTHYEYLPFIIWQRGKLMKIGIGDLDATICGCR